MQANPIAQIHIDEAVTDQKGHYVFKSWGPKFALLGYLRDGPELMFFKSGYKYFGTSNMPGSDTSKSEWNKKTVKLERFKGTLKEYAEHLFFSSLSSLWRIGYEIGYSMGDHCGWKSFPQMLRALNKLEAEYHAAEIKYGTVVSELRSNDKRLIEKGCGSILDVLGGNKK